MSLFTPEQTQDAFDQLIRERDEARAEVEKLKVRTETMQKLVWSCIGRLAIELPHDVPEGPGCKACEFMREQNRMLTEHEQLKQRLAAAERVIQKLLADYAVHADDCAFMRSPNPPCTCGLSALVAEYDATKGGE